MKCKICGSSSIKQMDDKYVCETCGVEYSKDEILNGDESNENIETVAGAPEEPKRERKKLPIKRLLTIGLPVLAVALVVIILFTTVIPLIKYNKAMNLISVSEFDEAYSIFTDLGDYKDSRDQILANKYSRAVECINNEDYKNAYELLKDLEDYKDAANLKLIAQLNASQQGDSITFGAYEQDNNTENGKENIEWIVIDKQDDKLLLISKYCLYAGYYNKETTPFDETMTWEECTRREWLNTEFLKDAFSEEDQARIIKSNVKAAHGEFTDGGKDTKDKLFFLSEGEVKKYLTKEQIKTEGTPYAKKKGAADNGYCSWWTRTPGILEWKVTCVDTEGAFDYHVPYDSLDVGIRPTFWIATAKEVEPADEGSEYIGQWEGKDAFSEEIVEGLSLNIHNVTDTEIIFDYTSPSASATNVTALLGSNGQFSATLGGGIELHITVSYDKITVDEVEDFGAMSYEFHRP